MTMISEHSSTFCFRGLLQCAVHDHGHLFIVTTPWRLIYCRTCHFKNQDFMYMILGDRDTLEPYDSDGKIGWILLTIPHPPRSLLALAK
jgi:hypothetical protein